MSNSNYILTDNYNFSDNSVIINCESFDLSMGFTYKTYKNTYPVLPINICDTVMYNLNNYNEESFFDVLLTTRRYFIM